MTAAGREGLAAQPLPATARQQVSVALTLIDGLDVQLAPLTRELRLYARQQVGCQALIDATTASVSRAPSRSWPNWATVSASRTRVTSCATPAWTSLSDSPIATALPVISHAKGRRRSLGALRDRPACPPPQQPRSRSS